LSGAAASSMLSFLAASSKIIISKANYLFIIVG